VFKFGKTNNNIIKVVKLQLTLKSLFKNKSYDLILFNGLSANQYFYLSFLKSISKCTAVIVHGSDGMIVKSLLKNYLRRKFLQKVDFIFPVSHYTDILVSHLEKRTNDSAQKSKVICNGVNKDKFRSIKDKTKNEIRAEFNISKDKFVILTVCDLIERKGVDILIKALGEYKKYDENFLHIIIGRGDQVDILKNYSKEVGIDKNILFIDYVKNDSDLVKYYKLCDVYCMVSKTYYNPPNCEGFGISYIEASYLGIPVIGGDNGGPTTAIKHNFTGYLVDPYSENCYLEISNYLNVLSKDKVEYERLSNNGKLVVSRDFTWGKNVSKILNIVSSYNANR
jgi:phosphatidylinositol alpha-1,6-mannosyltransferase